MTFRRLYDFASGLECYPIQIEGVIDVKAKALSSQDELHYVPVELDRGISLGHIKQYSVPTGVYGEPRLVTEIRYARDLNVCWKRYVCCKELMHVFDKADERVNSPDRFRRLVKEFEAPLPIPSAMYAFEIQTMWMALAILCPEPVRAHFRTQYDDKAVSDYELALALRIPEDIVGAIMSSDFEDILATL